MSLVMLPLRRTPAVSMATNTLPSRSKRTSTLSRVVPATSLTIMRSSWARALMKVLLPVLPADDGQLQGVVQVGRGLRAPLRQTLVDQLEQLLTAAVLLGA